MWIKHGMWQYPLNQNCCCYGKAKSGYIAKKMIKNHLGTGGFITLKAIQEEYFVLKYFLFDVKSIRPVVLLHSLIRHAVLPLPFDIVL